MSDLFGNILGVIFVIIIYKVKISMFKLKNIFLFY